MTVQVNAEYFDWLVSQVEIAGQQPRRYDGLFQLMHETEFTWEIPGDDNRYQDALDLRSYFSGGRRNRVPQLEFVSVLELLIALSRRIAFVAGGDPKRWAWQLVENLELTHFHDPLTHHYISTAEKILHTLVSRRYKSDGRGGFFPLHNPTEDQRGIEMWDQLNAYVNEISEPN
jgi:hypothetical protein